jgi:predicted phosphodiesterase
MPLQILDPEVFGATEATLTVTFQICDAQGPVDAEAAILLDGETRAHTSGAGTRLVRVDGLEAGRQYRLEIRAEDGSTSTPDRYFPERVATLPAVRAGELASFATLNDLHFGEPRVGGVLDEDHEYGDEEKPGFPLIRESDTEIPYWRFMNADAVDEINAAGVDAALIKGDIADRGEVEQFEEAAKVFAGFAMPHHAFLGNHDYLALRRGEEVDGYALLGQPAAPRSLDLGGWRLLLLETSLPGKHAGHLPSERRAWLARELEQTRETQTPTLVLMHHQPVPPDRAHVFPNGIGIDPQHSVALFELLAGHPQLRGVLIGHTHRNRVRHHAASAGLPYVEVQCSKDYPGGWAHYRLFEDGSFRQEVRRTASERALRHSTRCRAMFGGGYRDFALGDLGARSFEVSASSS